MKVIINGIHIAGIASCLPKGVREIDSLSNIFGEKQIRRLKKILALGEKLVQDIEIIPRVQRQKAQFRQQR